MIIDIDKGYQRREIIILHSRLLILIYDSSNERLLFYTQNYRFSYGILATRNYYSTLRIIDFDIKYQRRKVIILHSGLVILIYDISDEKLLFYTRDYQFHYTILVTRKYYSTLQIIDFDIPYWRHEISILHSALLILIYHFSNGKLLFCTRDY